MIWNYDRSSGNNFRSCRSFRLAGSGLVWASGRLVSGIGTLSSKPDLGPADVCSQDSGTLSSKPREFVGTPQVLNGISASCLTGARCSLYHTPHHLYPSRPLSDFIHLLLSPRYFMESTHSSGDLRRDSSGVAEAVSIHGDWNHMNIEKEVDTSICVYWAQTVA